MSGLCKDMWIVDRWKVLFPLYYLTVTYFQENLLLDSMFEIPGSDIVSVHVTGEAVRGEGSPIFIHDQPVTSEDDQEEEQALAQAKWGDEAIDSFSLQVDC